MAAELKFKFEVADNFKKKIQDSFKGVFNMSGKGGKAPAPNFKYIEKSTNVMSDRLKLLSKTLEMNMSYINKLNDRIANLDKIKKNIVPNQPGSMGRTEQINEQLFKAQNKLLSITEKSASIQKKITKLSEPSSDKNEKGGIGLGAAAMMGGMIGLLSQLVQSTKSIQFLMQFIGGMIDMLIGPLIPILLTLLKPFLMIFLFLSQFMFTFFKDPVAALSGLVTEIATQFKNLLGFGGKDKQKNAVAGVGAIAGGGIGMALGGPIGAVIGTMLGPMIMDWGIKFVGMLLDFGAFLGEKLADAVWFVWEMIKKSFSSVVNWGSDIWDSITTIFSDAWDSLTTALSDSWNSLKAIFSNSWIGVTEWLSTIWDSLKSAFSDTWEILKGFGNWIYTALKDSFFGLASIGKDFINFLIDGLNNVLGYISDGLGYIGLDFGGRIPKINDGVISPGGKIVSVNPKDYLLASKNPRDLMGGDNGNNITIHLTVHGNADRSMINEITKQLRKELSLKGAF